MNMVTIMQLEIFVLALALVLVTCVFFWVHRKTHRKTMRQLDSIKADIAALVDKVCEDDQCRSDFYKEGGG